MDQSKKRHESTNKQTEQGESADRSAEGHEELNPHGNLRLGLRNNKKTKTRKRTARSKDGRQRWLRDCEPRYGRTNKDTDRRCCFLAEVLRGVLGKIVVPAPAAALTRTKQTECTQKGCESTDEQTCNATRNKHATPRESVPRRHRPSPRRCHRHHRHLNGTKTAPSS